MAIVVRDALDTGLPDDAHEGLLSPTTRVEQLREVALLRSWDLGLILPALAVSLGGPCNFWHGDPIARRIRRHRTGQRRLQSAPAAPACCPIRLHLLRSLIGRSLNVGPVPWSGRSSGGVIPRTPVGGADCIF